MATPLKRNKNFFVLINLGSGERVAARHVRDCLAAELGDHAVHVLNFADREHWRRLAVEHIQNNLKRRAAGAEGPPVDNILVVAGGDGTVSLALELVNQSGVTQVSSSAGTAAAVTNENDEPPSPEHPHAVRSTEDPRELNSDEPLPTNEPPSVEPAADHSPPAAPSAKSVPSFSPLPEALPAATVSFRHDDFTLALAVLPMGTGNDMSRSLGFGPGFSRGCCDGCCCSDDVHDIFATACAARPTDVDLWRVTIQPAHGFSPATSPNRRGSAQMYEVNADVLSQHSLSYNFLNYLSIGFDAWVCREFHHFRQAHPTLCSKRFLNKLWYGKFGFQALFGEPLLAPLLMLEVDGCPVPLPSDIKSLVISNVDSFSGGVKLWSPPNPTKEYKDKDGNPVGAGATLPTINAPGSFSNVSLGDRKLEVQGIYGSLHMSMMLGKMRSARKIAQGTHIRIVVRYPELLRRLANDAGRQINTASATATTPRALPTDPAALKAKVEAQCAGLPKPLLAEVDGEALDDCRALLRTFGAIEFNITHRQVASMLTTRRDL